MRELKPAGRPVRARLDAAREVCGQRLAQAVQVLPPCARLGRAPQVRLRRDGGRRGR